MHQPFLDACCGGQDLVERHCSKACLAGNPLRAFDDNAPEGHGTYPTSRIIKYAADGCAPFWMQKGVVEPWIPNDRWDTPSRDSVRDTPETAWFMWFAPIVDEIYESGHMYDMKAEAGVSNSYRDAMIYRICWAAFGTTNPSRTQVVDMYGFLVGCMFSKGAQGRAVMSRALRQQVGELVEEHGSTVLSGPELERARAASAHGKRATSRAATAAGSRVRAASPKGKASSPDARVKLRTRTKTLERPRPLPTLVERGPPSSNMTPLASPKRARHSTRSPIARRRRQAASVGIPDPTQAPALAQNLAQMRGARREARAAAVAYSAAAAASSAAAAAPIPSSTPPRSSTPRSGISPAEGRRVRRKASPTLVGSVAVAVAAAAASLPTADAS